MGGNAQKVDTRGADQRRRCAHDARVAPGPIGHRLAHGPMHTDNRIVCRRGHDTEGRPLTHGRSLVGMVGTVLPTVGGVCCVGLSAGLATVGGVAGAALAWLTPLLLGVVLMVAGGLLVRARSGRPWRRWHGLAAVASAGYLGSALVVVPVLATLFGSAGGGGEVLP